MKKTIFIKNAIILTFTSLLLRFAGIIFKIFIAKEIGSEGIGLYQIIFSFYILISTFASTGISTAVTRLVSEEIAKKREENVKQIIKDAVLISLFLSFLTISIIYVFKGKIAV